jgi:hypothetical protein
MKEYWPINEQEKLKQMEEEQYAFRRGRATTDLIFTVRQIIEKNWEYGRDYFWYLLRESI